MQSFKQKKSKLEFLEENEVTFVRNNREDSWKVYLPKVLVLSTLKSTHEQLGHAGAFKCHAYLRKFFFWRGMRRDIKGFTRSCDLCQRVKYLNCKMEGSYECLKASGPNQLISVDFYGPLPTSTSGVKYLFVCQDIFTKLVTLYAIRRTTTQIILKKLVAHYFEKIGKPEAILSDHGSQFTSPIWKTRLEAEGIKVYFSSIRHPQSNPVERTMREIGRIFRTYCAEKHSGWAKFVPFVQECLNLTVHQSTGYAPYFLHYNITPHEKILKLFPLLAEEGENRESVLGKANKNLQLAFEQRCRKQKSQSKIKLEFGDLVLLKVPQLSDASQKIIGKFFHIYEGPFRISRTIGNNAFELSSPDDAELIKGVYNRWNLRKYNQPLVIATS